MSRKIEDFDEFCDPDDPKQIKYEEVIQAAMIINPLIQSAPLSYSHSSRKFVMHLYYKLESLLPTGSFKDRGIIYTFNKLTLDKKKLGVVIASLGNEGIAASYHGSKMGIPITVVMPTSVSVSIIQRCHALGAKAIVQGLNLNDAMKHARALAREKGLTYINGRDHPHMLTGYGTLAMEILAENPNVDAIIVPVGTGGLAGAVAAVTKQIKPNCLVYGVQPETVPLFFKTLENTTSDPVLVVNKATVADSINVTAIGCNSLCNAKPFLDKMLLVTEDWIARAMLHLYERQKLVAEGAGACPLAAIIGNLVPELKLKHVVVVVSGGTVNPIIYSRCLQRGLAAEGRLVKFRVSIKDLSCAQAHLLNLIANGGYDILHHFQTHRWVESDEYLVEMELVCVAKNLEHALELKRLIERAYPCYSVFETEPFNDKRVCPCYVYKGVCAY